MHLSECRYDGGFQSKSVRELKRCVGELKRCVRELKRSALGVGEVPSLAYS
jgi:hypothetical protein